jgi:hypothetical protein
MARVGVDLTSMWADGLPSPCAYSVDDRHDFVSN